MPLSAKYEAKRYKWLSSWWAQEFLAPFQDLDGTLLASAKSYIEEDKLEIISLSSNSLQARLDLGDGQYTRLEIKLDFLADEEIQVAKEILSNSSLIATEIALGKLPSLLNEELQEKSIQLLPQNLDAYTFRCSHCENNHLITRGQACEHSLALIYKLAEEIDKDAKLWLEFRGLGELLEQLELDDAEQSFLKKWGDILDSLVTQANPPSKAHELKLEPNPNFNRDLIPLDFNYEAALSLLEDKPNFDQEQDFKKLLLAIYDLGAKRADSLYDKWLDKSRNRKAETDLNIKFQAEANSYNDLFEFSIPIKNLLRYSLNLDLNKVYSDKLAFTLLMVQTAVLISKYGLYCPELVSVTDDYVFVRYQPLFNNDQLRKRLAEIYNMCPKNIFGLDLDVTKEQLNEFLTYLVTFMVKDLVKGIKGFTKNSLLRAFLYDEKLKLENISDQSNLKALTLWLSKLDIQNFDLRPLLEIEEEETFNLNMNLQDLNDGSGSRVIIETLKKEVLEKDFASERIEALYKQLYLLQDYIPALKQIISTEAKAKPPLDLNALAELLVKADTILAVLGLELALPDSLKNLIKPKLRLNLCFDNDDNFHFDYKIEMGEELISLSAFRELIRQNKTELFSYSKNYTLLSELNRLEILERSSHSLPSLETFFDSLYFYRLAELEGLMIMQDKENDDFFESALNINSKATISSSLKAKLKDHQEEGFEWLYANYKKGFGSCLADDMGLGKTLQVISVLTKIYFDDKIKKPSLVLCPSSLTQNWFKETLKFAPDMKVNLYSEIKENKSELDDTQVLISSFASLRQNQEFFEKYDWEILVVDEAHNIKNPQAKQSQAIKNIKAQSRVALTATPVEKKLADLWAIFEFLNPSYLRSLQEFTYEFSIPVEKYRDKQKKSRLDYVIAPFFLRREKSDASFQENFVKKNICDYYLTPSPTQEELYKNIYLKFLDQVTDLEGMERIRLIQKTFKELTLLANHPSLYDDNLKKDHLESAKLIKLLDLTQSVIDSGEKIVIFTQFRETAEFLKFSIEEALNTQTLLYHGAINSKKKEEALNDFQNDESKQVLIITLKAGGTGLNLVVANHLVHYDFSWNQAQEDQASDRIYRIGQEKDVYIHRLMLKGSFEQRFDELLKSKSDIEIKTVDLNQFNNDELNSFKLKKN